MIVLMNYLDRDMWMDY